MLVLLQGFINIACVYIYHGEGNFGAEVSVLFEYVYVPCFLLPVDYINCFDTCQCFALAFGVPAVLMVVSIGERGCVCMYVCM